MSEAMSEVMIERVDPASREARWCVARYCAELAARFADGFDPARSLPADDGELRPPVGAFLVATLDGAPVACGAVKTTAPGIASLKRMWVSDAARGRGLGRRMLHALETQARELGVRTVRLETNRALVEAIRLYLSADYVEVAPFNADPYADHWFEKRLDSSPIMEFDLATGRAVLERTPHALRAMLSGLPSAWTDATEGPETWSPRIIVGHLVQGERTNWIPRARLILDQGAQRRFAPFDRLAPADDDGPPPLADLLDEFARLRAGNLATLAGWRLTDRELALQGEHPEFGPVTLRQLLATWVAHDLAHLAQAARVMAKQYREAVGPWRAYLAIMDR